MKFKFPYLILYSPKICNFIDGFYHFGKKYNTKPGMALAIFPCFIVFRQKNHPMNTQWLNHEKIHHRQTLETFGISFLIGMVEYYYALIFLKYTRSGAYFYQCIEQEAYANQHNLKYLKEKSLWSFTKYVTHKPVQGTKNNYHVIIK